MTSKKSKSSRAARVLSLAKSPMTTHEKVYRMLKTPSSHSPTPADKIHVLAFTSFSKEARPPFPSRASKASVLSRPSLRSGHSSGSGRPSSLEVNPSIAGTTLALIEAAEKGDSNKVHHILNGTYFDVDYKRNEDFRTALQRACQYGHTKVVEELLKAGADPNYIMRSGKTLLHEACVLGHHDIVLLLVDFIQDVDTIDNEGQNACHIAAYHGENECLALLADKGANCTLADNRGRSPAHLAAQKNHPNILECLTVRGVDIESADENGKRPVHYAAIHGGLECLVNFLQCDCDTSIRDNSGCMAAHYAAAYNHIECLRFLVKHGATFDSQDASGKTLAHSAAQKGAMTTLHWLFEKGAETTIQDGNGNTPGHLATAGGHAKCFNCYLQHGGSLELINKRNETVMDTARRFGHPLLMNKACSNDVMCVHCKDKSELINWERSHQPTRVQKSMNSTMKTSYKTPLPPIQKAAPWLDMNEQSWKKNQHDKYKDKQEEIDLPPRDLAARYFTG